MSNCATLNCDKQVTQRGTIYCDDCSEERKANTKLKHQMSTEEIIHALHDKYTKEIERYKTQIELLSSQHESDVKSEDKLNRTRDELNTEYQKLLEENQHLLEYNRKLENETKIASKSIDDLRRENVDAIREKIEFEKTHSQLLLDIEKLKVENRNLIEQNKALSSELEENEKKTALSKIVDKIDQHFTLPQSTPPPPPKQELSDEEKAERAEDNEPIVKLEKDITHSVMSQKRTKKVSDFKHTVQLDLKNRSSEAKKKVSSTSGEKKFATSSSTASKKFNGSKKEAT